MDNNNCNFTTCRYNKSNVCTDKDRRKECIEACKAVLRLEDSDETL